MDRPRAMGRPWAVGRLRTWFAAITALGALLGVGFYAGADAQAPDPAKAEIRTQKLTENLYLMMGAGGNVAVLVGEDGAVLVDDEFAPLAPKLRAAIALLTERPVRFIVNTHWHADHTGGNEAFGRGGSVIVAHENTRTRLSSRQLVALFKMETPPSPPAALPLVTFAAGVSLHLDGEDIDVVHVPAAHTDSDAVLYFRKANVVHTGDVFVNGTYPFIDESSGGTLDGVIAGCAEILGRTDAGTRVIPGHGSLASRAELEAYHDMLVVVRKRIADLIRRGRSQQQVIEAAPTREFDDRYGRGMMKPDLWVQRVYVDLRRAMSHPPGARPPG